MNNRFYLGIGALLVFSSTVWADSYAPTAARNDYSPAFKDHTCDCFQDRKGTPNPPNKRWDGYLSDEGSAPNVNPKVKDSGAADGSG